MSRNIPKSVLFRVCIYPSPDIEGFFVAHCLELDLIGEGKNPQKAIAELIEAIELQIEACQETGSQFFFPAPAWVWHRYGQAKNAGRIILQRIVEKAQQTTSSRLGHLNAKFENVVGTSAVPQEYLAV